MRAARRWWPRRFATTRPAISIRKLHTHAVIANMLKGADNKWRTMANEKLYASKMLIGALYRSELAMGLKKLGYGIEKTHADGRFEIAGVSREVIEAFSTRRAEIQAAMNERGLGDPGANPRLAERAALMTRSHKREMDRESLRDNWQRQAADLGFDARALTAEAAQREPAKENNQEPGTASGETREPEKNPAERAVAWAVDHLAEREAVFSRNDLLAAALASEPGAVAIEDILKAVNDFQKAGTLHASNLPVPGESFTTDSAIADEKETIALMHEGRGRGAMAMRGRAVDKALRNGPLTVGQKAAVKLILSETDRVVGVQGYAGTGKTRMLNRTRALLERRGFRVKGLAPSASAAQTLAAESAIESETLQRFLARNAGVAAGRLTAKGERDMRAAFKKTVLVVDEGSLASTVQTRNLLRIARELRLPRVVLVGDGKQLDAVDAGKPFVQLQQSGMKTATMDEIMRQREPELKAAVKASLGGDIKKAFEKLGSNVAEVEPDNLAGAAAARWLRLPPEQRENTRADRAQSRASPQDQRHRPRAADSRRTGHGTGVGNGKTHVPRLHPRPEIPGRQLHRRQCRGVPPRLQAARCRAGRRTAGPQHRPPGRDGESNRKGRRVGQLGSGKTRRENRRGGSVQRRQLRASPGRPHSLDEKRRRLRTGQQPDGGSGRGEERHGVVQTGRRADARPRKGRSATTPYRSCLGVHGACVPGSHGGYRHRGDGGQPSPPDDTKDTVRGDQPRAGPGRACDRRPRRATRAAGGRDGRTNIGARIGRARTGQGRRARAGNSARSRLGGNRSGSVGAVSRAGESPRAAGNRDGDVAFATESPPRGARCKSGTDIRQRASRPGREQDRRGLFGKLRQRSERMKAIGRGLRCDRA